MNNSSYSSSVTWMMKTCHWRYDAEQSRYVQQVDTVNAVVPATWTGVGMEWSSGVPRLTAVVTDSRTSARRVLRVIRCAR